MISPVNFGSRFFGKAKTKSITAAPSATRVSNLKAASKGTGIIKPESPTINKMLKMLLPTIFPIAISEFFLMEAETDVNNSGNEVPRATIVKPIKRSLNPTILAMAVAASTAKLLPKIISPRPIAVKIKAFGSESFFSVSSEFSFSMSEDVKSFSSDLFFFVR